MEGEVSAGRQCTLKYSILEPQTRTVTLRPEGCLYVLSELGAPPLLLLLGGSYTCLVLRRASSVRCWTSQPCPSSQQNQLLTCSTWYAAGQGKMDWAKANKRKLSEVDLWQEPGCQPWGMFITNALKAHRMHVRGRDYLVEGELVRIVDPSTGRLTRSRWMNHLHQVQSHEAACGALRSALHVELTSVDPQGQNVNKENTGVSSWQGRESRQAPLSNSAQSSLVVGNRARHVQALECKEGLILHADDEFKAVISYQNLFCQYDKLAGMTVSLHPVHTRDSASPASCLNAGRAERSLLLIWHGGRSRLGRSGLKVPGYIRCEVQCPAVSCRVHAEAHSLPTCAGALTPACWHRALRCWQQKSCRACTVCRLSRCRSRMPTGVKTSLCEATGIQVALTQGWCARICTLTICMQFLLSFQHSCSATVSWLHDLVSLLSFLVDNISVTKGCCCYACSPPVLPRDRLISRY